MLLSVVNATKVILILLAVSLDLKVELKNIEITF
jgi:hypothetical protein